MMDFIEEYLTKDLQAFQCAFNNHSDHMCQFNSTSSGFDYAIFDQSKFV